MNRRDFLRNSGTALAGISLAPLTRSAGLLLEELHFNNAQGRFAEGYVFNDKNNNGSRQPGSGIGGVLVSNGQQVVKTDRNGYWRLPVTEDSILFVIKPSGYKVPVNSSNLPQFYYIHKPQGSRASKYRGVAPTGPLPKLINFGLVREAQSNKFKAVLFGDPQPRNQKEIDYISNDVVKHANRDQLVRESKFGISLGDEMFDVLSLFDSLNQSVSTIGLPWYNTVGNHDMNYDSPDDAQSTETFQRIFGPTYYAFEYGRVCFIVLDDVIWHGAEKKGYHGEITSRQLEFVRNYLAHVPKDKLIVIAMHIPIIEVTNREALYRLIEDRPHTLSLSAHTHVGANYFLGEKEGWRGANPHHHLNQATVCGSWWCGSTDERGIPHATMSDGGPNGYSVIEFDGAKYSVKFRAASRPRDFQMNIWIPEEINRGDAGSTDVVVNVFAGSSKSTVEMRVDGGKWLPLANFEGKDPYFEQLKALEKTAKPPTGLPLPNPSVTRHLWKRKLPSGLGVGLHRVEVRTTDMYGQTFVDRQTFRVVSAFANSLLVYRPSAVETLTV